MKNETIRISTKTLGHLLAMPDACPRCAWVQLNCRLPYQIFPGIFSSIDSFTKKVTWSHQERNGRLPDWFKQFGDFSRPVKAPSRSEFYLINEETNVQLTGIIDDIFQKKDGSYFIVDYKTSRFTTGQDALMPVYKVQLNGYAMIAEKCGLKPVTGIGLAYYEPQTNVTSDTLDSVLLEKGFHMPFRVHLLELDLKPKEIVLPLLKKVRAINDSSTPPAGAEGCQDCQKLNQLIKLLRN
ncbi:MAG: PD-(D/E)XK nuclease family protein [Planctomycetota bacterium]|jgi:hypothetical protein